MEFEPFPKIPRLFKDGITITEKIDGTNAAVVLVDTDTCSEVPPHLLKVVADPCYDRNLAVMAQSRKRFIIPGSDNFGFASWVADHAEELALLGPGRHFGEWWGQGIQRGYGLDEKRFSLFNTHRFGLGHSEARPACCGVVPTLYQGPFSTTVIDGWAARLRHDGSYAAIGYTNPEGLIVYHHAGGHYYKVLLENDDKHKGEVAA